MKYLLDTNICIHFLNGNQKIAQHFRKTGAANLTVSGIVLAELFFGAYKSLKVNENLEKIELFRHEIEVIFDSAESARVFGKLKADLKKMGRPTQDFDLLVASLAISNKLTLVSVNTRHFENIPGLKFVNWLTD
ncbi:MAG: PIN domain-containing protein [Candidatus Rifleibacteriota bacterium]